MLHVVVTARPSWARVKTLVGSYRSIMGRDELCVLAVGPAVSKRYGDIALDIPTDIGRFQFNTLHDSDDFSAIATTSLLGGQDLSRFWDSNRPSKVLVIADRTETLGVAVSASLMQIPLIHLQGGEISGSIDDKVRDANSKLADFHLTTNETTKERLLSIGELESRIMICGCPSIDLVKKLDESQHVLSEAEDYGGVGSNFSLKSEYGVIMFHPDTTDSDENNLAWIELIASYVASPAGRELNWFWFWPNPDHGTHRMAKKIRNLRENSKFEGVRFLVNVSPEQFVGISKKARLLIGNSSFGIREASFLGLPTINLGNRQKLRQRAPNVLDLSCPGELSVFREAVKDRCSRLRFESSTIYGDGYAGERAARAIAEWTPSIKTRPH